MEFVDYYAEYITSEIAYKVGRGLGDAKVVVQNISPFKAIGAVMVIWGSIVALVNLRKYKTGNLTKKQAITVTASESMGMGISAGLGLLADGLLKAYVLVTTAPSVLPFAVGVAVTTGSKITWDCKTKKNMVWCELSPLKKEQDILQSPLPVHKISSLKNRSAAKPRYICRGIS